MKEVWNDKGKKIVSRPNVEDRKDTLLLTETYLEQTRANKEFREIAEFFKILHVTFSASIT